MEKKLINSYFSGCCRQAVIQLSTRKWEQRNVRIELLISPRIISLTSKKNISLQLIFDGPFSLGRKDVFGNVFGTIKRHFHASSFLKIFFELKQCYQKNVHLLRVFKTLLNDSENSFEVKIVFFQKTQEWKRHTLLNSRRQTIRIFYSSIFLWTAQFYYTICHIFSLA